MRRVRSPVTASTHDAHCAPSHRVSRPTCVMGVVGFRHKLGKSFRAFLAHVHESAVDRLDICRLVHSDTAIEGRWVWLGTKTRFVRRRPSRDAAMGASTTAVYRT